MASKHPFRIFALPLSRASLRRTRALPSSGSSSANDGSSSANDSTTSSGSESGKDALPLLYFHVSQPDPIPTTTTTSTSSSSSSGPDSTATTTTQSRSVRLQELSSKALAKASDQWLKLGQKPKKSWMYWFYAKGEGLMDKIEFEEWMLKGVHEGRGIKVLKEGEEGVQEKIEVSAIVVLIWSGLGFGFGSRPVSTTDMPSISGWARRG